MGKISNYTRALVAKLQDVFAVDQTDNNVTSTKSVTVEQIGDTIAGTQVHSDLKTDNQTIIGGINELAKDKNIADEYDDTHTYNIGDITIYGNTLYICTTNNTTGDFDPSNWTATTIDSVIGSLSTLTTTDKSSIVGAVNEVVSTKATTGSAITFAPETGITAAATSAVINKTVLLNLTFSGSFTQNTWKKIGAMNVTPSISTIYVAGIHSSDGLYAGMIQIRSDKGIYFYPKVAISGTVGCTANFNIT